MSTVFVGFLIIFLLGLIAGTASHVARRHRPQNSGMHALRDDYAINPVAGPLRNGCGSFEIGVRLGATGRLQVGSDRRGDHAGTEIGPLVLRELALRSVAYGGSVRPWQTATITLMIDIQEIEPARQARAYEVLDAELRRYPYLFTHLSDSAVTMGPVTVALIGAGVPRQVVAESSDRYAFCDGNFADVGVWGAPTALVPTVSEHWSWRFGWNGTGMISRAERLLLHQLVRAAHADGRQVRVFGIPERSARVREAYWRVLRDAGVDVISTRKPRRLAAFLDGARVGAHRRGRVRTEIDVAESTLRVAGAR
jgi:hypothetical protein